MFKIYQASAGSGKTTHLVAEYLSRCFEALTQDDAKAFRHILAITFTNNATAEMKDRILRTLFYFAFTADYSTLPASQQAVLKMISRHPAPELSDPEWIQDSSHILLKEILYDYNGFSVSTIDSFFQRIIRGFSIELGLSMNFNLDIDLSESYTQAIDLLLGKISKEEYDHPYSLSRQVMEIVDQNLEQQGKSQLEKELRNFLQSLHHEDSYYPLQSLQNMDRPVFREHCQDWIRQRDAAKRKLLLTAEAGDAIFQHSGFEMDHFTYKKNGPYAWFRKLRENPGILPARGRMEEALERGEFLSTAFQKASGQSFYDDQIHELYHQAIAQHRDYADLKALCENINTFALIFDLQEILEEIKRHDNLFFLSDTNALINEKIQESDTPFIFEKLGVRYHDFLIDEFQDTSRMQWEDLLPLVKNALSGGAFRPGSTILFGDPKQAIYRFRSGDASLFQQLSTPEGYLQTMGWAEGSPADFHKETLLTNYRSAPAIIDFNNRFFTFLKELETDGEKIFSKAPDYYADVVQQNPEGGEPKEGFVAVCFKNADDPEDYTAREVSRTVRDALDRGFHYSDISVLSRGVRQSVELARSLSEDGFPVISSDSLLLKASGEVRLLIAALQCLLDPEDGIAQTLILGYLTDKSPLCSLGELLPLLGKEPFSATLKRLSIDFKEKELLKLPLYTLLKELMVLFEFQSVDAYLATFLDKVDGFMKTEHHAISNFLDYWEENKDKLSLSSPKNLRAITVTTVHKSKGLQYPVVIFPFARYGVSRLTKPRIWQKMEEGPIRYVPLKTSKSLEDTRWKDVYEEEEALTRLDDLNILYVAHTRPARCFYIVTDQPERGNYAKFLYRFIQEKMGLESGEEKNYRYLFGNPNFRAGRQDPRDAGETPPFLPLPVSDFIPSKKNLIYGELMDNNGRQIQGITVHTYLSALERFPQSLSEIEALEMALDGESAGKIKRVFSYILEDRELTPFFSPRATVWKEAAILSAEGRLFRPDRVALLDGKVMVVDYKTGQAREEDQRQLQNYVDLIRGMGYACVEGRLIYV